MTEVNIPLRFYYLLLSFLYVLESATIYILSMPHLYNNDNKFFVLNTVYNSTRTLTNTIFIVAG